MPPNPDDDAAQQVEGPPDRLKAVVMRGARLAGVGHFATQGLTLVTYLVIARLVSPAEYGLYASASLFVGLGLMLSGAGINAALIQRQDRFEEAANTAVISSIMTGLAYGLLALVTSPLIGWFFQQEEVTVLAAALSGTIVLRTACIVPDSLMQRRFSFMRRLVIDPSAALVFGIAAVWGAASGMGPWALVMATYVGAVARLVMSWTFARWRPQLRRATREMWFELANFARHVLGAEVLRRVALEMPAAFIGRYSGAEAIGSFRYAERIGMQPHSAITSVASYVLLPAFARIASDANRFREAFMRSLRSLALVAVPSALILLPLGEPVAVVLLGERWQQAGLVMMALSVYVASRFPISLTSEAFKATGSPHHLVRIHRLSLIATVVSVLVLFRFGAVAVAAGLSVSSLLTAAYAVRTVAPGVGVTPGAIARAVAPAVVASLAMAVGVGLLDRLVLHAGDHGLWPGVLLLALDFVAAGVIYFGVLALVSPEAFRMFASKGGVLVRRLRPSAKAVSGG